MSAPRETDKDLPWRLGDVPRSRRNADGPPADVVQPAHVARRHGVIVAVACDGTVPFDIGGRLGLLLVFEVKAALLTVDQEVEFVRLEMSERRVWGQALQPTVQTVPQLLVGLLTLSVHSTAASKSEVHRAESVPLQSTAVAVCCASSASAKVTAANMLFWGNAHCQLLAERAIHM